MAQYIFGYGSLIDADSRAHTGKTGAAIPVRLAGFRRGWYVTARRDGFTAVGIVPDPCVRCNGVLVEIAPEELPRFDARERGYDRVAVPWSTLSLLSGAQVPSGTVWTYVIPRPEMPGARYPIIQSYVDVILTGCLRIGPDFATEFITTTAGWEHAWLDDRRAPRYRRAMSEVPQAQDIDILLRTHLPHAFPQRLSC
jgi:hypothetical protein